MKEKQCYEILGITKRASDDELRAAYREQCKKWHPDLQNGSSTAAHKFADIVEAYKTIKALREEKNKSGKKIFGKTIITSATDKEGKKKTVVNYNSKRGADAYIILELTFEEACLGCKQTIKVYRMVQCSCTKDTRANCPNCRGKGVYKKASLYEVQIPSGVHDQQCIKITGKGNEGSEKGNNGDLIIKLHVAPNSYYRREMNDIYSTLHITYPEAVFGCTKVVQTIHGPVEFDLPQATDSGKVFCLRAKGILNEDTGEIGNQYVTVHIDVPLSVTDIQKELLKKLQSTF